VLIFNNECLLMCVYQFLIEPMKYWFALKMKQNTANRNLERQFQNLLIAAYEFSIIKYGSVMD